MININSLLKLTKNKKVKSFKNNELIYLTILLVLLSLTFNLDIKKEFKIILLIIAVSICFYKPLLIGPFLIIIYIIYLQNKKKSSNNSKKLVEGFENRVSTFKKYYDNPESIKSKKDAKKFLNIIKKRDKLDEYKTSLDFIEDIGNCFFFDLSNYKHLKKSILLSKKYSSVQELYDTLEFTDITNDKGFNTYPKRDQQETLLKNDKYLKLGLFFYKTKSFTLQRYIINSSNQLGFYSILNNTYEPDTQLENTKYINEGLFTKNKTEYESLNKNHLDLKKKIKELVILFYYFKFRTEKDGNDFYDYNKKIELSSILNIFELIDKNFITEDKFELGKMIKDRINYITTYKLINTIGKEFKDEKISKETFNKDFKIMFPPFLKVEKNLSKIEKKIDTHINNLLDNVEEIKLINIKVYKITDRKERKEKVSEIYHNLFLINLINDTNLNAYMDKINESREGEDKKLYNIFKNLYNKKKKVFDIQIKNEELMDDKYQFTSPDDLFYDNLFFYFSKKYNDRSITKSYPEPKEVKVKKDKEDKPAEKEDDNKVNPFFEQQQKNFELELDDFLTDDQVKERQEEALEKYYKFLDKENIQKLEILNNLADNKNLSEKHEQLKLDYKIENFGTETYKIIDEIIAETKTFFKEIRESDEDKGLFANYPKYIQFLLEILNIMTKEDRVLYSGFIFVLLGLFIYFISDDKSRYIQQSGGFNRPSNLLDLLRL